MKINWLLLLSFALLLGACATEDPSKEGNPGDIVKDLFRDKAEQGVDILLFGDNDAWTVEMDREGQFVFRYPELGIDIVQPFANIGEDTRGEYGTVFTVHSDIALFEINLFFKEGACLTDARSFHVIIQVNPEISEDLVMYKGCGFNIAK
jgi:hypothetical protein